MLISVSSSQGFFQAVYLLLERIALRHSQIFLLVFREHRQQIKDFTFFKVYIADADAAPFASIGECKAEFSHAPRSTDYVARLWIAEQNVFQAALIVIAEA